MHVASETTALLQNEWLEAFWCDKCQETKWYHVKKVGFSDAQSNSARISYEVSVASRSDWQQSTSVIFPAQLSVNHKLLGTTEKQGFQPYFKSTLTTPTNGERLNST